MDVDTARQMHSGLEFSYTRVTSYFDLSGVLGLPGCLQKTCLNSSHNLSLLPLKALSSGHGDKEPSSTATTTHTTQCDTLVGRLTGLLLDRTNPPVPDLHEVRRNAAKSCLLAGWAVMLMGSMQRDESLGNCCFSFVSRVRSMMCMFESRRGLTSTRGSTIADIQISYLLYISVSNPDGRESLIDAEGHEDEVCSRRCDRTYAH